MQKVAIPSVALSQQGGRSKTTQANFSDSGFSSDSRALGGHMRFLVSPALHDKWGWLCGLWTHLKSPFTGFFSSVHQVPSPTCSWPGSTRSLWGGVLPIFPDMAPKTAWVIMLLRWDQLLEAYTRGASAQESILEKGTHITPLYS